MNETNQSETGVDWDLDTEVSYVAELLNSSVSSKEERLEKEEILKEQIPLASNETVIELCVCGDVETSHGYGYIHKEFEKRVEVGERFPIDPLIQYAERKGFGGSTFSTKYEKKLYAVISQAITNSTKDASQKEIIDVLLKYADGKVDLNCPLLDNVFVGRKDVPEIIENAVNRSDKEWQKDVLIRMGSRAKMVFNWKANLGE
jgi:hypothetical protein